MFGKIQQLLDTINQKGGVVLIVLVVCVIAYFLIAKKRGYKYRKQLFGTRRIVKQGTDIPLEGDLLPAYYILNNQERVFPGSSNLLSVFFVRWIVEGRIQVLEDVPKEPYPVYLFPEKEEPTDDYEKWEFRELKKAAGTDLMLTRYKCYLCGQEEHVAHCDLDQEILIWFESHNYIKKRKLFNLVLNPEGAAEARKVVELENYLKALIAGTASVAPDPDKVAYYVQFSILYGKWPDFKEFLMRNPDCCTRLSERLHCRPDQVADTIDSALLTIEEIDEGAEYADED